MTDFRTPIPTLETMRSIGSLVFLDCEATSLSGIVTELGLARVDLTTGEVTSWSALVRHPNAENPRVWDLAAIEITGITPEMIESEGLAPEEVIRQTLAFLGEAQITYSDAPGYDGPWVQQISEASLAAGGPAFDRMVVDIGHAFSRLTDRAADISLRHKNRCKTVHRAEDDARDWACGIGDAVKALTHSAETYSKTAE